MLLVEQRRDTEQADPVAHLADHLRDPEAAKHPVARDDDGPLTGARQRPNAPWRPADARDDPARRAARGRSTRRYRQTVGEGLQSLQMPIIGGLAARRSASSLTIEASSSSRRSSLTSASVRCRTSSASSTVSTTCSSWRSCSDALPSPPSCRASSRGDRPSSQNRPARWGRR